MQTFFPFSLGQKSGVFFRVWLEPSCTCTCTYNEIDAFSMDFEPLSIVLQHVRTSCIYIFNPPKNIKTKHSPDVQPTKTSLTVFLFDHFTTKIKTKITQNARLCTNKQTSSCFVQLHSTATPNPTETKLKFTIHEVRLSCWVPLFCILAFISNVKMIMQCNFISLFLFFLLLLHNPLVPFSCWMFPLSESEFAHGTWRHCRFNLF